MKKLVVSLSLVLLSAVAWALPTVQQVEAAIQQGRYAEADNMMREVVAAKPGSAKGHYIYAEILAHEGHFAQATEEARRAREIDPQLTFTQADKFRAFEQLLQREQGAAPQRSATPSRAVAATAFTGSAGNAAAGTPAWLWGGGLAVVAALLWRGLSRSRSIASASSAPAGAQPPLPYGAAMPYGAAPSSPSNGLLGTGLVVAGGVAAGMLLDEALHRRTPTGTDQLSGLQHGIFDPPPDDGAASELEHRGIDFGNGSDWDATGDASDIASSGADGGWD